MKHFKIKDLVGVVLSSVFVMACGAVKKETNYNRQTASNVKAYWYDGTAEISSYKLSQARYGQLHEGTAVLVYVTEPFSISSNTKADHVNENNVPVLKLNTTKKFTTGIYPYSLMSSTFFPFEDGDVSLKMAAAMQEWCGISYLDMKSTNDLNFNLSSYFEGSSFSNKHIEKSILEDDIWSLIRLNPELLPVGNQQVVPSMFYALLRHQEIKAYDAVMKLSVSEKGLSHYEIKYPKLNRSITIAFESEFPNKILSWEESYVSGYGKNAKVFTTKADLIKTIKSDYWRQNLNQHKYLRDTLGL